MEDLIVDDDSELIILNHGTDLSLGMYDLETKVEKLFVSLSVFKAKKLYKLLGDFLKENSDYLEGNVDFD